MPSSDIEFVLQRLAKAGRLMKTGQELLELKKALAEVEKRCARLIGTDDPTPPPGGKHIRKGLKTS